MTYVHDPASRLTEKWMPNGVKTRYQYNSDNTLSQSRTHQWHHPPYKYVYDELNRLKEVRNNTTDALIESYAHDALGHRTQKTVGSTVYFYQYDLAHQL